MYVVQALKLYLPKWPISYIVLLSLLVLQDHFTYEEI